MAFAKPSPSTIVMAAQRRERPAYFGGYFAAKLPRGIELLPLMFSKDPLRQSMGKVLMTSDHSLFLIGLNTAVMVNIV